MAITLPLLSAFCPNVDHKRHSSPRTFPGARPPTLLRHSPELCSLLRRYSTVFSLPPSPFFPPLLLYLFLASSSTFPSVSSHSFLGDRAASSHLLIHHHPLSRPSPTQSSPRVPFLLSSSIGVDPLDSKKVLPTLAAPALLLQPCDGSLSLGGERPGLADPAMCSVGLGEQRFRCVRGIGSSTTTRHWRHGR